MDRMKNGCIVSNMGHSNTEIDVVSGTSYAMHYNAVLESHPSHSLTHLAVLLGLPTLLHFFLSLGMVIASW